MTGPQSTEPVDTHDPAGMAAFMRRRAECSREFLKLTSEEQIRQFMESWQRNVLPHFAFRFEQGAELIERLALERLQAVHERDCAVEDVKRLTVALEQISTTFHGNPLKYMEAANKAVEIADSALDVGCRHTNILDNKCRQCGETRTAAGWLSEQGTRGCSE